MTDYAKIMREHAEAELGSTDVRLSIELVAEIEVELSRLSKIEKESLDRQAIMDICEGLETLYPDAPSVATQLVGAIDGRS